MKRAKAASAHAINISDSDHHLHSFPTNVILSSPLNLPKSVSNGFDLRPMLFLMRALVCSVILDKSCRSCIEITSSPRTALGLQLSLDHPHRFFVCFSGSFGLNNEGGDQQRQSVFCWFIANRLAPVL